MAALAVSPENIRRIVVRSPNWIGDAVMTTPAMSALRSTFFSAEIVVAAKPLVAELFRHHPYCDRVLVFDKNRQHRGMIGLLRFSWELRREWFDLAVLFQNAMEAAVVALAAGIPRRAGYRTDGRGLLLTHPVAVGRAEQALHHTQYYLRMLDRLGIRGGDGRLLLRTSEEEKAWAAATLGKDPWIAINPGATYGSAKRWFPERFAAVADQLAARLAGRIVLTGGPAEADIGREIGQVMQTGPLDLIGKTSVRQLMAVLERCRLLITNDSGPMHVAAALGVPLVAIFGPTDHATTSALADSARIVRHPVDCAPCLLRHCPADNRCMAAVSVEDVVRAAEVLLS
jgi:heptosyltransferase-2